MRPASAGWPALPLAEWEDTLATLQRWTQIVGKVRMVQSPWVNHSWSVTLQVTPRGLATGIVPHGDRAFEIELDFVGHRALVVASDGGGRELPLAAEPVADFYRRLMAALEELGLPVTIDRTPNELDDPTPFHRDETHRSYDPDAVSRLGQVLRHSHRVMQRFRSSFLGKSSPVHFFWGAFDLAVTRFSGRPAPEHPGGAPHLPLAVAREAYSHEVASAGWWPGTPGSPVAFPAYYAYAYPSPDGFDGAAVRPAEALWSAELGEWVLPYDAVRESADPDALLLEFLQSSYEVAAELAGWDRAALERQEGRPR